MPNHLLRGRSALLDPGHALRDSVLACLSDADLDFSLGGQSLSLQALFLEHGSVQMAYTRAFQTGVLGFDLAAPAGLKRTADIQAWFGQLDADLIGALAALSDEDLQRPTERGGLFAPPLEVTFYTYRETLLILAAKASVYLRALNRPLPPQLRDWVG